MRRWAGLLRPAGHGHRELSRQGRRIGRRRGPAPGVTPRRPPHRRAGGPGAGDGQLRKHRAARSRTHSGPRAHGPRRVRGARLRSLHSSAGHGAARPARRVAARHQARLVVRLRAQRPQRARGTLGGPQPAPVPLPYGPHWPCLQCSARGGVPAPAAGAKTAGPTTTVATSGATEGTGDGSRGWRAGRSARR